jgi:Transglutaminase-like superfamily
MLKTWRGFWRLSASEKSIVLEAMALLAMTFLGLRLVGFLRWKKWMTHLGHCVDEMPARSSQQAPATFAISAARLETAVARHFPVVTNCLDNSMALHWLLRRHGIPADLRIGARKLSHHLEAHAWVEFQGAVLGGAPDDHLSFVPFAGRNTSMKSSVH